MSPKRVAVIDYGMGNLRSVCAALSRLGAEPAVTADPAELARADALVLPGVGAFGDAAGALSSRGLTGAVRCAAAAAADGAGRPFLGICLGLQLLFRASEEAPGVEGLGVLPGAVRRFPERSPDGAGLKVPHMGWNEVTVASAGALTAGLSGGERFYFVHSFYAAPERPGDIALACEYGGVRFAAMAARGRLFATQFHPEKSQARGLAMLGEFLKLV
ncbi:MAG TPA: imidazole glycerol phosphate synthase subunit HisH [Planctomycetota bacterium]|nr:imidazole glycerol phosphate synthase subunit HisH [Planctomycetota bacterium]